MKYLVFDTQLEAIEAEAQISLSMGYPKLGTKAVDGSVSLDTQGTDKWADVLQIADGRWVIASPDDTGVEAGPDWFIQEELP